MHVKLLYVRKMKFVTTIGFTIHVNANLHFLVKNVIKVRLTIEMYCFLFYKNIIFLVAPIILFNQSSFIDISSLSSPIANISFFFNTLQPNGTLFQLISSPLRSNRLRRDLTLQNRTLSKILGSLINGRFHLIVIDNEFNPEEYELFHEKILNDGQPHQIQLDLNNNQLIIDRINIESLTNIKNKIIPKKLQLIPYGSLDGWLQDLRVNDRLISLINTTIPQQDLNITVLKMKQLENNPCYPYNPCQNHAQCIVTNSFDYL